MPLSHDVRLAIRLAARDYHVTLAVVAALSLAITANATVFSIYNGLFLRPLPFDAPASLVVVNTRLEANPDSNFPVSRRQLHEWRGAARTFTDVAGFSQATFNLSDVEGTLERHAPERLSGAFVSGHTFDLLGARPLLGRALRPDDDRPGAPPVVLLSHRTWTARYGRNPALVGSPVRVNGAPATVVGVMPARFGFPTDASAWQPLSLLADARGGDEVRNILVIGRLAPDASATQALADLTRIDAALPQGDTAGARLVPKVRSFREFFIGGQARIAFVVLLIGVGLVLLVACANVASLLLARGVQRSGEIAVRMSIGASRGQIVRQLLLESLVLASVSTAAGLLLSLAGVRLFEQAIAGTGAPYWFDFGLDARVFTFLVFVCFTAAVLFGLLPALHTTRAPLTAVLGQAFRGSAATVSRRWNDAFVVAQFAFTLTLLMSAGLVLRELVALRQMQVGMDTTGVTVMRIDLPRLQYTTPQALAQFYARLEERFQQLNGMRATYATMAPASGAADQFLGIDGRAAGEAKTRPVSQLLIGPDYFDVIHAGAIRGRVFTRAERNGVAIVNERLARLHFPGRDPIGARIRFEQWRSDMPASEWFTIVGVAPDVRQRSTGEHPVDPVVYVPSPREPLPFATLLVRSALPTADVSAAMRTVVEGLDPNLPIFDVRTLDDALAYDRWATRLFGTMFTIVAAMALLLASVGLYALTAYSVSLRTRELGVRIALGGRARHICWAVGGRGVAQIAAGLLLGAGGALAIRGALDGLLRSSLDATLPTLMAVASLLVVVALAACFVPARRALRLNPVDALRAE
jgi:putative ABC transport system permease protein